MTCLYKSRLLCGILQEISATLTGYAVSPRICRPVRPMRCLWPQFSINCRVRLSLHSMELVVALMLAESIDGPAHVSGRTS